MTIDVAAFSAPDSGATRPFSNARISFVNGVGLGVCNSSEGTTIGSTPSSACQPGSETGIDNNNSPDDFLLFHFDPTLTLTGLSIRVVNQSGDDTDIRYWSSTGPTPSLVGTDAQGLTFITDAGTTGNRTISLSLGPLSNFLIGTPFGQSDDRVYVSSITADFQQQQQQNVPAPEPATMSLLALGLGGLAARRRLRKQ